MLMAFLFNCSNSPLSMVNQRLRRDRLLKPQSNLGVLRSNENILQEPLNTNVVVEQLDQIQSGKPISYPRVLK